VSAGKSTILLVVDPSSVDSYSFGGRAAGAREDAGVPDAQVTVLQAGALPSNLGEASPMDVLRALFPVPMNRALGLCNEEHAKLHPFKPWPITEHELVKFMGVL
jgi:hypothetical protein